MSILEIFLLSLALAADAVSVGAAVGLRYCAPRQIFRLSFHFGLFQSLMPLLGALVGRLVLEYVRAYDHWVAFALLSAIGLKMLISAVREAPAEAACQQVDPTTGWSLVGLSVAVSIDAFAAGVGMALTMSVANLLFAVMVIGIVCGLATWFGMRSGKALHAWVGNRIEAFAGLVLIAIGIRMIYV